MAWGSESRSGPALREYAAGLNERMISPWCGRRAPLRVTVSRSTPAITDIHRCVSVIAREVQEGGVGRGSAAGCMTGQEG